MKQIISGLEALGEHCLFFMQIWRTMITERFESKEFISQLASVSWRSLPTTLTAGIFTGAIMAVQFHLQIKDFGANATLGGLATSGTLREVGPVLIAFMLAGKVGAYSSAELGTMKVTDQIDALRCLGVNPLSFLIVPRFLAVVISSMLLLAFGLVISVTGGILAGALVADISPAQYVLAIPRFATPVALGLAVSKAFIFGILMGHICCANGYWTTGGSRGVGLSVKRTAVESMVAIVLADFSISWIVGTMT